MSRQTKKKVKYSRPWLYAKQRDAIFTDTRYSLIEASTKTGKTQGCLSWMFEQALRYGEGDNVWWVAPVSGQAEIAFMRMLRCIPKQLYTANMTKMTIKLNTGCIMSFKSADKPDSLYGDDVKAAVLDEASRMKEDAWFAVRSTLTATSGLCRIIGNVKGRKNWFFKLCRRAEAGLQDFEYHKMTAYDAADAGVLSYEEIEGAKRELPIDVFNELYLAEPSDDGGNPFGIKHINDCLISKMSDKEPVVWGWDLAKSYDWTVGIGLDEDGHVCRFERFQKPWPETIASIRHLSGDIPALIDSTGVGDAILDQLQKLSDSVLGFKFTSKSKQQLMEGLAVGIQNNNIGFIEGVMLLELEAFEYEYTRTGVRYSAPEGMHDDAVCALALAYKQFKEPRPTDEFYAKG